MVNFDKYLNNHATGYVIKTYINKNIDTIVIGNRQVIKNTLPMLENSIFDIASLTKFFTSTLVYIAYEKGLIDLNDTIYNINPKFINLKEVKVLDLLSHKVELWTDGYIGNAVNKEELYSMLYNAQVKSRNRVYVDSHYMILSLLLEHIYNKPLRDILYDEITNVLNMKNTTFKTTNLDNTVACSFDKFSTDVKGDLEIGIPHDTKARTAYSFNIELGHAGIFTTADDMLTFLISFIDKKYILLKKETIEFMFNHDNIEDYFRGVLIEYITKHNMLYNESFTVNDLYEYINTSELNPLLSSYCNCGVRYINPIKAKNDIFYKCSSSTYIFSGYTGPNFLIDFENQIIILVMCNVRHNCFLDRDTIYSLSKSIINDICINIYK